MVFQADIFVGRVRPDKFHDLETDDVEARFNERLRKIAKSENPKGVEKLKDDKGNAKDR